MKWNLIFLSLLLAGTNLSCYVPSIIVAKTVGETIPAKYIPAKAPTLILAESYRPSAQGTIDADQLAIFIAEEMRRHEIAPIIEPVKVMDLRSKDPAAYRKLRISEIGNLLGAQQVLYVNLDESSVEYAGTAEFIRATARANVKFVDVRTGETIWPTDASEGYPASAQSSWQKAANGSSEATARQATQQSLALQIGRLFRNFKADE